MPESEDEGLARMSLLEHLEELRSRILKALIGLGVAYLFCLIFALDLWRIIQQPARGALIALGVNPPSLVATNATEQFSVIYVEVPFTAAFFFAAPWILYQVWAFIAPGLYARERRWVVPFILVTAGLFIAGGLFAYFLVFRYALTFLLGIGLADYVRPMVTISDYFDTFFNVTVGIALVFELPVLIFALTLLRIASPRFLLRHSRYAIMGILILAAAVTPTLDAANMLFVTAPMCALYFVGVFAGYLVVLRREGRQLRWRKILVWAGALAIVAAGVFAAIRYWRFH